MDNPEIFVLAEKIAREQSSKLAKLEEKRRDHLLFVAICTIPMTILGTPLILVAVAHYFQIFLPLAIAAPMALIISTIFTFLAMDESYRKKAKHDFMYALAEAMGLEYRRGGFITLGDLYDHHILPPYAQSHSEEGFAGQENEIDYQFQDFRIASIARLHWFDFRSWRFSPQFYALAVRIELGRRLDHHTILMPNFMANGFLKMAVNEKFQRFEDIDLVFSKFKKRYTILSTDQVEARYVFDPAMMERIMALDDLLGSNWLEISFRGREMVIIAGQVQNHFEVGHLFNPINVLTIEKNLLQLEKLKASVRVLALNPHTGLGSFLGQRNANL